MKIAIVNSRKPRQVHPDERWLQWTMALGYATAKQGHTLSASVGTIGYDAALFGAAMGNGKIRVFVKHGEERIVNESVPQSVATNLLTHQVLVLADGLTEVQRDQAVINDADLVVAVAIRSGGQMESLLKARHLTGKRVQVVDPESSSLWGGSRRLLELGVPLVAEDIRSIVEERLTQRALARMDEPHNLNLFLSWKEAPLVNPTLAHFTRGANGSWPGQSNAEYLKDLWHGGWSARRDARATLSRIMESRRIQASGRLIRGSFPMVSFTAVSPERIADLHRYRSHLIRWDFEPWGLVFDRDWLMQRGARPVKYLPAKSLKNLAEHEQPFFQKHEPPDCDFSAEEEWRIQGDVDFSAAPIEAVRLVRGD